MLTLVQTERISVKVLAMLPNQTEPEHWHPPVGDDPGKEETIRVVAGTVYFYVQGESTFNQGFLVKGKEGCYTLRRRSFSSPGTNHVSARRKALVSGPSYGAVMYSFSSVARDALDQFRDPNFVKS